MKKSSFENSHTKKGYNEKKPGKAGTEFQPASANQVKTTARKSNAADKKQKEDQSKTD